MPCGDKIKVFLRIVKIVFLVVCTTEKVFAEATIDLWSGQENRLPYSGIWQVATEHGRVIASGNGPVRFAVPELTDGTTLTAVLSVGKEQFRLRFHSSKVLNGMAFSADGDDVKLIKILSKYGGVLKNRGSAAEIQPPWVSMRWEKDFPGEYALFFPSKYDFPLDAGKEWTGIRFVKTGSGGSLSLTFDKKEQILDLNGTFTYAILQSVKKTAIVFTPSFDLNRIDNILLVKKLWFLRKK